MYALPVYDDRYIKTKIITHGDKVYTNLCGLNVPENDVEYESFTLGGRRDGFKFPNFVCNGCRDLTILCPSLRNIAIITV